MPISNLAPLIKMHDHYHGGLIHLTIKIVWYEFGYSVAKANLENGISRYLINSRLKFQLIDE